ncbi:hypothetical protein N7456_011321 [Penicillium angulare]|uniref:Uncharacterized protein n=1 Tax=Penicillium angulare TaxID=116970 RepID=A0A9W9JZY4_9EURO|nr:hypothetical protein N7456_011321 [Penicillium angulare]
MDEVTCGRHSHILQHKCKNTCDLITEMLGIVGLEKDDALEQHILNLNERITSLLANLVVKMHCCAWAHRGIGRTLVQNLGKLVFQVSDIEMVPLDTLGDSVDSPLLYPQSVDAPLLYPQSVDAPLLYLLLFDMQTLYPASRVAIFGISGQ